MSKNTHVFEDVIQPVDAVGDGNDVVFGTSRWMRFIRWSRRVDLAPKLELLLAIAAIAAGVVAYTVLSAPVDPLQSVGGQKSVTLMIGILAFPIIGLAALIARRLFYLISARRQQSAGSRLHGRIVMIFAGVAIVPTLLIGIVASLLFEFGYQVWFSDRVRTVLDNAATVAEGYVREHRKIIEADLRAMANDLNRSAIIYQNNRDTLQQEVFRQAVYRSLNEAILFDGDMSVRARASFNLSNTSDGISRADLNRAATGELVVIDDVSRDTDRVGALLRLDSFYDMYLYVSRRVDPKVMASYIDGQGALSQYQELEAQRKKAQIQFNLMLISVAVALLLAAIMLGLWFATRLTSPISHLVSAAEQIRLGDLSARVPLKGSMDEIGTLARAFNRMTSQLQSQRQKLILTNEELEGRRLFIETVLEGVSAGVMGLTGDGKVNAINKSALDLLKLGAADNVVGQGLAEVAPKLETVRADLIESGSASRETQVEVTIDDVLRTFDVKLSAEIENGSVSGYVLTFDDMTQQLSYQRRAAWADVARRIAHEIKNPLTPIQLSAERLRRKYLNEIETDPSTFEQCTNTIIRQVNDLRNMVDEFSSFARMPAPVFRLDDVRDVIKQTVFLQQLGTNKVEFKVDLPQGPLEQAFDRRLISQALTNILKNAVESIESRALEEPGFESGRIEVQLLENDNKFEIFISDNGKGLPVAERLKLMEPYVTTRAKGTGLGLAIVKKIIEDHGADIQLEDAEGGGAIVRLRFGKDALLARYRKHMTGETEEGENFEEMITDAGTL